MNELLECQKNLWAALSGSGVKPSEVMIISSGRQTGKSHYYQMLRELSDLMEQAFKKIDSATVDGEPWYTVKCRPEVGSWIRSLPNNGRWHETIDTNWYVYADTFDVCEQLYIELGLKFTP